MSAEHDTLTTDDEKSGPGPTKAILYLLGGLGAASALWALFLWQQLMVSRAGGTPYCAFGAADCGELWSAAFASTIHRLSGVPVAGWGVAWGVVAAVLPLLAAAFQEREGRLLAATRLTALAGVLGVGVMLAASAAEGLFCGSCAVTYLLSLAYGGLIFLRLRGPALLPQGALAAAGLTLVAYLGLLYPGLATPKSQGREGQRILQQAASATSALAPAPAATPTDGGTAIPDADARLRQFFDQIPPEARQWVSDSLLLFQNGPYFEPEKPRVIAAGTPGAPLLITEFTDVLCSHCATLHENIQVFASLAAPGFRVDARHFPLDGRCNPHLAPREGGEVRCLAAKAQICVEGTGRGFEFAGSIFAAQRDLDAARVFALAAPFMERSELEACLASPETERTLLDDVEYAFRYEPRGTPLVLLNGRRANQFGPFLYAMILAGGDPDHPAFDVLPEPDPKVLEPPPEHEGHDHEGHDH